MIRLGLVYFAAVAVALPIAIISLAKLLLVLGALLVLVGGGFRRNASQLKLPGASMPWILLALAMVAVSSLWSTGSHDEALSSIAKHGKQILIPAILCLVRNRRQSMIALGCFIGAQIFLLASTWLLALGIPLPWAKNPVVSGSYAIFSTYLDQSIMTGVFAAICWHLKAYAPVRYRTTLAMGICALALSCVFFIFQGRTGHVVAIALITLALLWEIPKRRRVGVAAIPVLLVIVLAMNSGKGNHGLAEIGNGISAFSTTGDASGSSGIRLDLWRRSLQSISENPVWGSGAGSWSRELNRQQNLRTPVFPPRITANPHQEYLLWGIELGVPGIALLCAVLAALYRDSRQMAVPERRALQSVLAALGLSCLFNCALYDALIGDFFCIALALVLALGVHPAPPKHSASSASGA